MMGSRADIVFFDDELLSSWLIRQRLNRIRLGDNTVAYELFLKDIFVEKIYNTPDIDTYYDDEIISKINLFFGDVAINSPLNKADSGGWLLQDIYLRSSFCPLCIKEDLKCHSNIYWRKSWSSGWYTICEKHAFPLVNLYQSAPVYENLLCRTGDAFSIACEGHWIYEDFNSACLEPALARYKNSILLEGVESKKPAIQYGVASIAWAMQNRLIYKNNVDHYNLFSSQELAIDLIKIAMRKYFKRFESPPLASELTRLLGYSKTLRSEFEYNHYRDGSPDPENSVDWLQSGSLVQDAEQVSAVQSRMMAIAIVGVLLDIEGAGSHWSDVVQHARLLGWILPQSKQDIFEFMVADTRWDVRKWLSGRTENYSSTSKLICERFL